MTAYGGTRQGREPAHITPNEGPELSKAKFAGCPRPVDTVTAVPGDGLRLVADHFDIHLQGGVAWAEGLGRISNSSGAERPVRMTCVLVREEGQWVIVQSHASLPVRDAEIFKLEPGG